MRRPTELASDRAPWPGAIVPAAVWNALKASSTGNLEALREVVALDPRAATAEFEGTRPLHLAVRQGHDAVVGFLLEAGADPSDVTVRGADLVTVARERDHLAVAQRLERAGAQATDRPDLEARWRAAFTPLDFALWTGPFWNVHGDLAEARRLAGSEPDIVIAAALGERRQVEASLRQDAALANHARPTGKRALSAAIEFQRPAIVSLLLEHGADPCLPEGPMAPQGSALHAAARLGDLALVDELLAHGADPNAFIDSSGSATYAAATGEIREHLIDAGGNLTPYDWIWLGEDDTAVHEVLSRPASALDGCGTAFAATCTLGKPDLMRRLIEAGAPMPVQVNGCRSYLLERPAMLAQLLRSSMDPDLADWQGATLLHEACARDRRGRPRPERLAAARLLLDAGADLEARDDDLRSRPLAWAARAGLADVVRLLLERGAARVDAADPAWAIPLAWATRRGHADVIAQLRS